MNPIIKDGYPIGLNRRVRESRQHRQTKAKRSKVRRATPVYVRPTQPTKQVDIIASGQRKPGVLKRMMRWVTRRP